MGQAPAHDLASRLAWCKAQSNPLHAFNETILGRVDRSRILHDGSHPGSYWRAQRAICRALWDPSVTVVAVPAGHSVGKSYGAAGIVIGWLTLLRDSMVVTTSPSQTQLSKVLWKEIRAAFHGSPLSPFGKITAKPELLDYSHGRGWHAIGQSVKKPENIQGHHAKGPVLNIIDEASGVDDPAIWATLKGLKPTKTLLLSNPLRPDGPFYEVCQRAARDPSVRLIRIPSTHSPDIELEHSERGLADAAWLREMRADYGEGSLVWRVRVEARFPDDAHDTLIAREWLDLAGRALHKRAGPTRLGIDLAEGNGGDRTVFVVRDDTGILHIEGSNTLSLEQAAAVAAQLGRAWAIEPQRVTYDASGTGTDFGNRLEQAGIKGARAYKGSFKGGPKFTNLRSASGWALRNRLDPNHQRKTPAGLLVPQVPFAIRPEFVALLREELQGLRYHLDGPEKIALEEKEELARRLRRSPDVGDALLMTFAYPG